MGHINVTINGRQYRMACEEGQEVRLLKLAQNLEARIETLHGKFGEIGDARLTVMAALTACDELADAGARIRSLEEEVESLRNARAAATDRARASNADDSSQDQPRGRQEPEAANRGGLILSALGVVRAFASRTARSEV
jgi:cell division protein ZapA